MEFALYFENFTLVFENYYEVFEPFERVGYFENLLLVNVVEKHV